MSNKGAVKALQDIGLPEYEAMWQFQSNEMGGRQNNGI